LTHRSTSAAPPVVRRRRRGAPFRAGGTTAARELLWLEDHETALAQRSRHRRAVPPRLTRGVDLCELEFAYPGSDGERTLAGLDLTLPAGRSIALVGENGAGKTTLVKLLCGMCHPSRGRVVIDGVDLAEMDPGA
jgi:ATP-binding cassette subfamily B protein